MHSALLEKEGVWQLWPGDCSRAYAETSTLLCEHGLCTLNAGEGGVAEYGQTKGWEEMQDPAPAPGSVLTGCSNN